MREIENDKVVATIGCEERTLEKNNLEDKGKTEGKRKARKLKLKRSTILLAILAIAVSIGLAVAGYVLSSSPFVPVGTGIAGGLIAYWLLSKEKSESSAKRLALERDFVEAFSYFSVFIQNGYPVYRALELTTSYSSKDLAILIQSLLSEIDDDKSIGPFLRFADHFDSPEIRQVMIAISRMVDEGGGREYIEQFRFMFASVSASKRKGAREAYAARLSSLAFIPLVSSALSIILVTLGVLSIMGGYASGF